MKRTIFFENIIQEPDDEQFPSLFAKAFPDNGLTEYAAYKALAYLSECWGEEGREHNRASVDFVTGTLRGTIECLTTWLKTWEAAVVADMEAERVAELLREGNFSGATDRMNKVKALVQNFNPADLTKTREMLSTEYSKIQELVDAAKEST